MCRGQTATRIYLSLVNVIQSKNRSSISDVDLRSTPKCPESIKHPLDFHEHLTAWSTCKNISPGELGRRAAAGQRAKRLLPKSDQPLLVSANFSTGWRLQTNMVALRSPRKCFICHVKLLKYLNLITSDFTAIRENHTSLDNNYTQKNRSRSHGPLERHP